MHKKAMVILQLTVSLITCAIACARTPLYVGALFEFSEHHFKDYTPFFPKIIDHALKDIRNKTNILQDYDLQFVYRDTKGQNGYAARQLVGSLNEKDRPKVAVIGPSLSRELIVTGQIAPYYNVIELSCIATTASTVDEDLYPTVFTVNQVPHTLDKLRIEITRYFGWKLIGTLAFQKDYSISQIDSFHSSLNRLHNNDIQIVTTAVVANNSNIKYALERFKDNNVRIIHAAFTSNEAPFVFCEAFKQGMYGDSYVWILSGTNIYKDWTPKANKTDCTEDELVKASDSYLTLNYHTVSPSNASTVNGQRAQDILDDLEDQAKGENISLTKFAGWIYDMIWALSLGLNNSLKYLDESGLRAFNNSKEYLDATVAGMKEVDFTGMSGRVNFAGTRFRKGESFVQINKAGGNTRRTVAYYEHDNGTYKFNLVEDPWPDGWPTDRFMKQYNLAPTSSVAFGLIITILVGGLLLALGFAGFNSYYRKQRSIKMSSPVMNNIIIIGCVVLYVEVFVASLHYHRVVETGTCMICTWLLATGFTTIFGALFSKTYRVYAVFRDGTYKSKDSTKRTATGDDVCIPAFKGDKDYHLIAKVGALLAVDCFILIPWTLINPQHITEYSYLDKKIENINVISYTVHRQCSGDYEVYWFGVLYIYKGLLLVLGTFLAWETRTVRIAELNDSKYIGACIYNVVIVCVFGVPVAHVLSIEQTTFAFVLTSCLIVFCTTVCLCIIFVPKIRYRNQVHGKFILPHLNSSSTYYTGQQTTNSAVGESRSEFRENTEKSIVDFKRENETLRMQIAKETIAMAKLKKTLLQMTGDLHLYKSGDSYVVFRKNARSGVRESNVDLA